MSWLSKFLTRNNPLPSANRNIADYFSSRPDITVALHQMPLPMGPLDALDKIIWLSETAVFSPRDTYRAIQAYNEHFKKEIDPLSLKYKNSQPVFTQEQLQQIRSDTQIYTDLPFTFDISSNPKGFTRD